MFDLVENARQVRESNKEMERLTEEHNKEMEDYVQQTDPANIIFG